MNDYLSTGIIIIIQESLILRLLILKYDAGVL